MQARKEGRMDGWMEGWKEGINGMEDLDTVLYHESTFRYELNHDSFVRGEQLFMNLQSAICGYSEE